MNHRCTSPLARVSSALAFSLAVSCGSGEDRPPGATGSSEPGRAGPEPIVQAASEADGRAIRRDSQVVHVLITVNTGEVGLATIARSKTVNASVWRFADEMVTDHGAATERLQALARTKGIVPEANSLSEALKKEADAVAADLQPLTGPAFDKAYIDSQVTMHAKVLAIIDDVLAPVVSDPDLKSELAGARAHVAEHLQHAEEIQSTLGRAGNMAGTVQR